MRSSLRTGFTQGQGVGGAPSRRLHVGREGRAALKSTPPPCGREQVGEPCLGFPVWKMGTRLVSPPGRPGALTEGYKAPSAARNTQ